MTADEQPPTGRVRHLTRRQSRNLHRDMVAAVLLDHATHRLAAPPCGEAAAPTLLPARCGVGDRSTLHAVTATQTAARSRLTGGSTGQRTTPATRGTAPDRPDAAPLSRPTEGADQ